jgi:antitoxin YefM
MKSVSESTASKDLGSLVEEVWESRVPVVIHRDNGHSAVVISIDDFDGMAASNREELDETEYLLSNPENARRLLAAVEDVKNGRNLRERQLIDE